MQHLLLVLFIQIYASSI